MQKQVKHIEYTVLIMLNMGIQNLHYTMNPII